MPKIRNLEAFARGSGWPSAAALEDAARLVLKLDRGGLVDRNDVANFARHYPAVAQAQPRYLSDMAAKLNAMPSHERAERCTNLFGFSLSSADTRAFITEYAAAEISVGVEDRRAGHDVVPTERKDLSPAQARARAASEDADSRREHINAMLMGRQPTPGEHRARIANALDHTAAMSTVLAEAPRFQKFSSQSPGKADSEHRHDSVAAAYDALALKGEAHEVLDADAVSSVEQAGGGGATE